MGCESIPEQGSFLHKRVEVCFNYDTSQTVLGEVIRDDKNGHTYIWLDDGRLVTGVECQYRELI